MLQRVSLNIQLFKYWNHKIHQLLKQHHCNPLIVPVHKQRWLDLTKTKSKYFRLETSKLLSYFAPVLHRKLVSLNALLLFRRSTVSSLFPSFVCMVIDYVHTINYQLSGCVLLQAYLSFAPLSQYCRSRQLLKRTVPVYTSLRTSNTEVSKVFAGVRCPPLH